jgi:hypothetical protein
MREKGSLREAMAFRSSPPPPADDLAANVAWLRDRTLIADLYDRYAYGVDSADMELVRSVFHPDCVVTGTMEQGSLDDYLEGIGMGVLMYHATMHFKGNQYIALDGDRAFVETWVVGYHMEAPGSPLEHLKLGLRYRDEVIRCDDNWLISRREAVLQWHTGPFPRPALGEPPYPRRPHRSPGKAD